MSKDKEGGDVVPGMFGGKHTIEHLIENLREHAKPEGPALIMFDNKAGDVIPIVLNLSLEDLCLYKEILGGIIRNMISGGDWEEGD